MISFPVLTKKSRGFTLIEMMVAVALFSTVMMIAVGALMSVVGASRRSQAVQSVIDNLDFALDDMSRTIRTGTDYHCGTGTYSSSGLINPLDGSACSYVAVEGSHGDPHNAGDQIVYRYQTPCSVSGYVSGCIMKSTDGGLNFLPITSPEINIDRMTFYVLGSCPRAGGSCTGDTTQPRATLFLGGHINYQGKQIANLNLETNMTQRLYDI